MSLDLGFSTARASMRVLTRPRIPARHRCALPPGLNSRIRRAHIPLATRADFVGAGTRVAEEPYKPWCCGKFPPKCQRSPKHGGLRIDESSPASPFLPAERKSLRPISFSLKSGYRCRHWAICQSLHSLPPLDLVSRASVRKLAWIDPVNSARRFFEFRIHIKTHIHKMV